jgi:hypothetical protein
MSDIIYLSNVRLSFPHIVEPQKTVNEQTGQTRISYNGDFIMPKDHAGVQQFMQRYSAMAVEKWKEHAQTVMQMIQQDRKTRCYGLGEERVNKKTFQPYDGYAGMFYISAGRDTPPQMIQPDGSPVDPSNSMAYQQLARKMYGGCRVNVAVKPWLQENKHGRGIRCDLVAIQFDGDDKAFGEGNVDASGMFGAVASGAAVPGFAATPAPAAAAMPAAPFAAPAGLPPFMTGQ